MIPVEFHAAFAAATFLAIREGRARLGRVQPWRLVLAAAAYLAFLMAHPWIAGVPAM